MFVCLYLPNQYRIHYLLNPIHSSRLSDITTDSMMSVRAGKQLCSCSPKQAAQTGRAVAIFSQGHTAGLGYPVTLRVPSTSTRNFSTTGANQLRDIFPRKETAYIRQTPPAWPHHGHTQEEMESVVPAHRKPETVSDWLAWKLVRTCRWWMDLATGIRPGQQVDKKHPTTSVTAEKPLTEAQWLGKHSLLP